MRALRIAFRLSDETLQRSLEKFRAEHGMTVSQAVRTLLSIGCERAAPHLIATQAGWREGYVQGYNDSVDRLRRSFSEALDSLEARP